MELDIKKHENIIVVYLKERFDVHLTEKVEKEFSKLLDEETSSHFILNLHDVEYLSSSGIGLFVSIMVKLKKRDKKIVLCELNSSVKKIIELVEMTRLFNICRNEAEAFEFLRRA